MFKFKIKKDISSLPKGSLTGVVSCQITRGGLCFGLISRGLIGFCKGLVFIWAFVAGYLFCLEAVFARFHYADMKDCVDKTADYQACVQNKGG